MNTQHFKALKEYVNSQFVIIKTEDDSCTCIDKLLNLLYFTQSKWAFWDNDTFQFSSSQGERLTIKVFQDNYPTRRKLALFRLAQAKGFIGGCSCGCRGDFEITDSGLNYIDKIRYSFYSGY